MDTDRKTVLVISPKNRTLYNFRGKLIEELIKLHWEVIATGPDETDICKLEDLGISFIEVPLKKNGTNVFDDLTYCFRLYRICRSIKPNVVFSYTIKPVVFGSIAARLASVERIVSMVTGVGFAFGPTSTTAKIIRPIVRFLYKMGLRCATHVIFQNPDDQKQFVSQKLVNKSKCTVVNGSGVDLSYYTPSALPENMSFFMLGRIIKSKGVLEYLQAASQVKELYPDVTFSLLGAQEEVPDKLPEGVLDLYVNSGVVQYFAEQEDVRPFYAACSVFVLPSYREGTPRAVLEAMAMGKAIITTDTPGCRETVCEGENGFLVPAQDSSALADKMIFFIENQDVVEKMGEKSLEIAQSKYDVKLVNQDMLGIIASQSRLEAQTI